MGEMTNDENDIKPKINTSFSLQANLPIIWQQQFCKFIIQTLTEVQIVSET